MTEDKTGTDIETTAMADAPEPPPTTAPAKVVEKAPGNVPEKIAGKVPEIGGPKGPEPTRFGDWERNGICVDF
jgi:hypothetical protein